LILTNSLDGTSDILVKLCSQSNIPVFRFNIDLYLHYEISFTSTLFHISDPAGRTFDLEEGNTRLLWRKPFLDTLESSTDPLVLPIVRGNISAILQTIVHFLKLSHKKPLVEPYFEAELGKLIQLRIAASFFATPDYEFSLQRSVVFSGEVITKPLRDPGATDGRIFYTSKVEVESLQRPGAWFVQEALIGGADVTGVYIDGKTWFFKCDYQRDDTRIDWRTEINTKTQAKWSSWHEGDNLDLQVRVHKLMTRLGLRYGRLDFILDDKNELWFLECNSNGQFGWLDDESLTLHRAFLASAVK
jgi:hypothetical protein